MSKQNPNRELRQSVPANKSAARAPTRQCFLVCGYYTQPPEDENDSAQEESYSLHFFSANNKSDASKQMVRLLKDDGFRKVQDDEAEFDDYVSKWTDEWAVVVLQALEADDVFFWTFFTWEPSFWESGLLNWANANPVAALSLARSASAGDSDGHKALANHGGLFAVVQKHELEASVPAGSTFTKHESKRI